MKPVIIRVLDKKGGIVVLRSVGDHKVVACGRSLGAVLKKAARACVKNPAVMFVPRRKGHIY